VPIPVPFMAVAQEVAAAVSVDTARQLSSQLQVFGAVRWLATDKLTSKEIFSRLERLSGYRLYACDPRGGELIAGVPVPPPERAGLIPKAPSSPPTVSGGCVVPVAGPNGHAGWVLALESPHATPAGLVVVQHIATVAALRLAMFGQQREAWRREGAETFSEMMQGPMDPARIVRRLGHHGFAPDADVLLAITGPLVGDSDDDAVADLMTQAGHPHLLLRVQDDVYVLLPATGEALDTLCAATTAPLGTSRPFRAGAALALAVREARWAVGTAISRGLASVAYGDDPTVRWLTDDSAALHSLTHDVLGAVTAYDREHSGDLLGTARTWLEFDRRTERAAEALHVHPNTLLYRLRRFEEITGRSLSTTQGVAEVWLALRATAQAAGVARPGGHEAEQRVIRGGTSRTPRSASPTRRRRAT
jgi:purine catabolism regulator